MVFSSPIFMFLFLPLFLSVYYLTPTKHKSLVILLGSYIFYGWWRIDFLLLFFGVTVFNYFISIWMLKATDDRVRKRILMLGVAGDLATLGYFKYFNFGVAAFNDMLGYTGAEPVTLWSVILPIGISFYIFHAISYIVDIYRGHARVVQSFIDFAAFIALLPQLVAGPVLRYKDLAEQFVYREHSWDKFSEGVLRFSIGLAKKVLIADTVAPVADYAFAMQGPGFFDAWVGILAYALQLYFDFSGYSDMAIGIGLMMGFRFIENFNHPYISRSITEFWRRWHISLSTWLRDYLYVPLGGNRKGKVRTYVNLLLTMVLGGIWHGANWTFFFWGVWHGGILALERLFGGKKDTPYPRLIAWPLTFFLVLIGWVLFRAPNMEVAMHMYSGMFGLNGFGFREDFMWDITPLQLAAIVAGYFVVAFAPMLMRKFPVEPGLLKPTWAFRVPLTVTVPILVLLVMATSKMLAQSFSPFLYFQF